MTKSSEIQISIQLDEFYRLMLILSKLGGNRGNSSQKTLSLRHFWMDFSIRTASCQRNRFGVRFGQKSRDRAAHSEPETLAGKSRHGHALVPVPPAAHSRTAHRSQQLLVLVRHGVVNFGRFLKTQNTDDLLL